MHIQVSFVIAGALGLQAALSATCLALFVAKFRQFRRGAAANHEYRTAFDGAGCVDRAARLAENDSGCARLATVGFGVMRHGRPRESGTLKRSLSRQACAEHRILVAGLAAFSWTGTAGALAGLFGVVWGFMLVMQDANPDVNGALAMYAGQLGMSLAATAIGIAVAIAAGLAGKYFEFRVKSMTAGLEEFVDDFMHLAQRVSPPEEAPVSDHRPPRLRLVFVGGRSASRE